VAIALLGLKLINVKPSELFQTTDLKKGNIVKYIFIGITIQYALSLIMGIIVQLFSQNGIDIVEADLVETGNAKSIALEIIYACIVAPLTEELLFRGFAMKSLSRVSQRFAIIISAFIFGLIHGNVTQFIVAFVLGIFMGYIDIKHNSLIPSIAIHVAMNTFASILNYLSLFSGTTGDIIEYVLSFFICIIMIIGAVMFILFAKDNRLPYNTPHQSVRSNSMILKSPALVILIVFEIALIIATNVLNNQ
jgi:membrane protease YdiL (CAAX protease family)